MNQSSTMTDNIITDNTMTNNIMTDNIMTYNTLTTMTNNTMTDNTIKEMPTYDRAIRDMKNGAKRYRVLEDFDEEGTYDKVQNVRFNNERE